MAPLTRLPLLRSSSQSLSLRTLTIRYASNTTSKKLAPGSERPAKADLKSNTAASTTTTTTSPSPISFQPPVVGRRDTTFAMRTYKPRTPGTRHLRRPINDHLWKGRPLRSLTYPKKGHGLGGRNRDGRVTVRHRGGGAKRRIRTVDFLRVAPGPHMVERIEHDPNRSAHIALVKRVADGKQSYIIAADGMRAGDVVESFRAGLPKELLDSMGGTVDPGMLSAKTAFRGNCLPVRMVPVGAQIFSVGSQPSGPAVFCRSAGTFAIVVNKEENRKGVKEVHLRMQSGEIRKVDPEACCTIGVASNPHFHFRQLGKAGRKRWLGIRPTVRGLAMNAADHPHGGGRGKSKGNRIPSSPWGQPAKSGFKTRKRKNVNKNLIRDRERNQGKRRSTA